MLAATSSGDINLDGLVHLQGALRPSDAQANFTATQVVSLHSDFLTSVSGKIVLYNAPLVEHISFPNLQSIGGSIYIGDVLLLKSIGLSAAHKLGAWLRIFHAWSLTGLKLSADANVSLAETVGITETALTRVLGFTSTPGCTYFQHNRFLEEITLDFSETTVWPDRPGPLDGSGDVVVSQCAASVNISLPNLSSTAGNLQLDNCSALSTPALYSVNGPFTMQNAGFQSLEAPDLGVVAGTLNITGSFRG